MIKFTLLSRSYCHLCDDMLHQLEAFPGADGFTIEVIDVDQDEQLVERYNELVPVLLGSKDGASPEQICNYFLDQVRLTAFLENRP